VLWQTNHWRVQKIPSLSHVLRLFNPVHILLFHAFTIHINIFHSLLRLPSGIVPSDFPPKVCEHYLFYACLVPGPYHSLWFCQPHTSGGRNFSHTYPQPRSNWVEATYKPVTWNSPALSPAREISIVCHEHDGLRVRERCWLYQEQESPVVNSQVEH
jgi:hypothetical protein